MLQKSNSFLKTVFLVDSFILVGIKLVSAQTTLDSDKLKIEKQILYVPPLDELKDVLGEALAKNFAECTLEIVDCPDLMKPPFTLAAPGLTGKPTIVDVGGRINFSPPYQRTKIYDLKTIIDRLDRKNKSFIIGASDGPWPFFKKSTQLIVNTVLDNSGSTGGSRIAYVNKKNGNCILENLPANETRFAILAHLFLSEGKPGKVLKVHAIKRRGKGNFVSIMQEALAKRYQNILVGLGGTFLVRKGKVRLHILPDFFEKPIRFPNRNVDVDDNFYFFNMSAPMTLVGTFVSARTELDLLQYHFHGFSRHGEGGHYRTDVSPDLVEYLGYFNPAELLYRVDQPPPNSPEGP